MLNSRVFIPTLECLRALDRLESRIPQRFHHRKYFEIMKSITLPHQEWLDQVATGKKVPKDNGDPAHERLVSLTQTWLYELGLRRSVWCWNRWTYEQHAMWKLYGQRGVAIHSNVGGVRRALMQAGADGIVSPVKYVYQGMSRRPEEGDAFFTMLKPKYLPQPYLFKDAGFRFEEEVRFVLRVNPTVTGRSDGSLLDIAASNIIPGTDFDVSEELPRSERGLIRLIGYDFLKNGVRLPSFPDTGLGLTGLAPSNPFSIEPDLPLSLFPDLE
jgi:hypothetical protein